MNRKPSILFAVLLGLTLFGRPSFAAATLELVTNTEPPNVFFGAGRKIPIIIRNPGAQDYDGEIRGRVFQTSSATAVAAGETVSKKLRILAGQTVIEPAAVDFPAINSETRFVIQWWEGTNRSFGATEVFVHPANVLGSLKELVGDEALGVFDPLEQLKPLLGGLKMDFADLENGDLDDFSGKLAIIGPFESRGRMGPALAERIRALANRGVAVVWIQPPGGEGERPQPSFYAVPVKRVAVVVAQSRVLSNLRENPRAQENLIYFCRLALMPAPPSLPGLTTNDIK